MKITRYIQIIAMALLLTAASVLSGPQPAFAVSFTITYQNYWTSTNTDRPGYPPSPAGESGSQVHYLSGSSYHLQAVSSAYGQISCSPFTVSRGAGAHHQEFWNVWLQLVGEVGEQADLYIDSELSGSVDLLVGGFTRAFTVDRSYLDIRNAANTNLLDYYYTWSADHYGAAVIVDREFEDVIDSLYLGTMIVGDPVWGSIHLTGYQFATATAQAYNIVGGVAICDIVSRFTFDISALESPPPPEPIPDPSTLFLIGSGILGLAGLRRKIRG